MNMATLKSKTFWMGVLQVLAGGILAYTGNITDGLILCGVGLTAITGSDRASKILEKLRELEKLKAKV